MMAVSGPSKPPPAACCGALYRSHLQHTSVLAKVNYVNGAGVTIARQNLTNLSPHSYNATLYYEDSKISTRVSAAWRSRYLTAVQYNNNGVAGNWSKPVTYGIEVGTKF